MFNGIKCSLLPFLLFPYPITFKFFFLIPLKALIFLASPPAGRGGGKLKIFTPVCNFYIFFRVRRRKLAI